MLGDASPFDIPATTDHTHTAGMGSRRGVLCIHGFTGSPFEMRYLGEFLGTRGYRAVGPALSGHCASPADLDRTEWRDWYRGVEDALSMLCDECEQVAVVGLSLGGLLALHLAREHGDQLTAVASLAAPLWLGTAATWALRATERGRLLGRLVRNLPKLRKGGDTRDPQMRRRDGGYQVFPVRALHEFNAFMTLVRDELEHVAVPTLVMHAVDDHTAPFAGSYEICARVQRGTHRKLTRSFHNITIDVERDIVAREVADFLDARFDAGDTDNRPQSAKEEARP